MQPQKANNKYDFILDSGPKPRQKLPNLGLPRPVMLGLVGALGLIVVLLIFAVVSGGKNKSVHPSFALGAQAQEIARVSSEVGQDTNDAGTDSLAATVNAILSSQENQFINYWSKVGKKASPQVLAADKSSSTDQQIQTATQNNNLPATYISYLKSSLTTYSANLASEYKLTHSSLAQNLLMQAYNSVQTILGSLKS